MSDEAPRSGLRAFLIVWFTQSVSVIGSALTLFAVNIWLVEELYPRPEQQPQLALALALINLAFAIPAVVAAPLAGAWADRHDRKRTMLVMDLGSGCLSLLLVVLLATGALSLPLLLAISLLSAAFAAFHSSAFDSSISMLVPEAHLPRANGMMQTTFSLSGIVSPALAAGLIALPTVARQGRLPALLAAPLGRLSSGMPLAVGLDAVTFFLAALTLLFVHIPSPQRADLLSPEGRVQRSIWADVREGGRFIWRRRPLLWLLGSFTAANLLGSPVGVLQPLLVKFNLAADWAARGYTYETALALLSSVGAVGGLVGGLLISTWGGLRRRRVLGVLIPLTVGGLAQAAFGLSPWLYLTAAMACLVQGYTPIANAHSQAIWQAQTPRELQGRVFAVRRVIAQGSWPLSTAIAGLVAGRFNPGTVLALFGVALALFAGLQLLNPYLMRMDDKAWLDRLAAGGTAG